MLRLPNGRKNAQCLVAVWVGGMWNGHFPESRKYGSGPEICREIPQIPQKERHSANSSSVNFESSEPRKKKKKSPYPQPFHTSTRLPSCQKRPKHCEKVSESSPRLFFVPFFLRYRPKGVFGKGVGNSKNASEIPQKCVKNGSCFIGPRGTFQMRQKCVKITSKMHQKCAEHLWGRTPFGRYRFLRSQKLRFMVLGTCQDKMPSYPLPT